VVYATRISCFARFFMKQEVESCAQNVFSEIASLRSVHDGMSAKPCDNCKMIMVNYTDLWFVHSHVANLLDSARLELRELKTRSMLFGACTSCPLLRYDLEAFAIEIKDLNYKLNYSSHYTILSLCAMHVALLMVSFFHAIKKNTELK
jgi:hypothetical protein